jgi:multiple sugar transport system permease protein
LLFTLFPLLFAIRTSFYAFRSGKMLRWVGWDNFTGLFEDEALMSDLKRTVVYVIVVVAVEMVLGFALALLFNREMRGVSSLRTIMVLPLFASPIALGYLGKTIFYEIDGPVNRAIEALGGTAVPWLSDPTWAFVAIMIVDIWQWTPFVFLVSLAGLQALPQDITEAAQVDGASPFQRLRGIILPLMAPILWLILLLRTIDAFKVVDIVVSMTLGGPGRATELYGFYVFRTARRFFNYGAAAAQGFLLLMIVMVLVSLLWGRIKNLYDTELDAR